MTMTGGDVQFRCITPFAAGVALIFIAGCFPLLHTERSRPPSLPPGVHSGMRYMNPRAAMEIIDASANQYVVEIGRLRVDSLRSIYADIHLIHSDDLVGAEMDAMSEAGSELDAGSYRRAADIYRDLLQVIPGCAECHSGYAEALLGMANVGISAVPGEGSRRVVESLRRRATDHLLISGILDPDRPVARGMLMPVHVYGRPDIRTYPQSDDARRLYIAGMEAHMLGELELARYSFQECVESNEAFSRGYLSLGDTYFTERDFHSAVQWYLTSLRTDSTDYLAWRSLAQAYTAMGSETLAREACIWAVIYNYQDNASWKLLEDLGRRGGYTVTRRRMQKRVDILPDSRGGVRLILDETLDEPQRIAWLGYAFIRSVWLFEGRFQRVFEAEQYSPSFREEHEALNGLLDMWLREAVTDSTLRINPELMRVLEIAQEGYLGEYVLFEELAADNPVVMKQVSSEGLWRVREYIRRYVLTGLRI